MSFRISQPSFQSLYIEMLANGQTIAGATAFVAHAEVGDSFLITNRHNVTGRNQDTGEPLCKRTSALPDTLRVHHNASSGLGTFIAIDVPLCVRGTPTWIEHPTLREAADFVALPIDLAPEVKLYPYRARQDAHMQLKPAQSVSVVGFPFGERTGPSFAVWATGFVASEPEIDHGGRPVFLIDCRSRTGQSGSPVILHSSTGGTIAHENGAEVTNISNRLLGVYSGRTNEDSDLGVVWKAYALADLLVHASLLKLKEAPLASAAMRSNPSFEQTALGAPGTAA